mmetsp:Transcript_19570/g.62876  ORF Transcript_19570/g.62876 Transcript_19570/m.62876 type:complete len:492 (+) Transcript_19570:1829-3304(+)|eukprot:CAMPEP_0118917606 /NCGR_PEP_ID=MMETSP1166-20130328/17422_1 /TAXON_ID=1104430 /ORGANISM="Chrysoreinhardia sp, Strain CCMP3193" /LENGTH=491 /DNA_ID=CAMNT_0006857799 /DNA_START=31 /DNA_END=1506 /DNA_ORIENTATION=+
MAVSVTILLLFFSTARAHWWWHQEGAAVSSSSEAEPLPRPPPGSSALQVGVVATATKDAEALHAAARPKVEALFEEIRPVLERRCPSISKWSGSELARLFESEMAAVELVSNFYARRDPSTKITDDLNMNVLQVDGYWPNQWQLLWPSYEGGACDPGYEIGSRAEVSIYGFPAWETCMPWSFDEASQRPLYTAVNTQKIDVGNPYFGDVAIVWKRSSNKATIVASADTGMYEFTCGDVKMPHTFPQPNCTAGAPVLGTASAFFHLILHSQAYYNSTTWLANHACRLLTSENDDGGPLLNDDDSLTYWEAVVAESAYFDGNVRFVVASFASLFGDFDRVRDVCRRKGWILLWGYGDLAASADPPRDNDPRPLNQRLLDPLSAALLDEKILYPSDVDAVFDEHWRRAALQRRQGHWQKANDTNATSWQDAYADLAADLPLNFQLEPLAVRDNCRDLEACVGANRDTGHCICYHDGLISAQSYSNDHHETPEQS